MATPASPLMLTGALKEQIENDALLEEQVRSLAQEIVVTVVPPGRDGARLQDMRGQVPSPDNVERVKPPEKATQDAAYRASRLGLRVLRVGRYSVTVSGPAHLIREQLGIELGVFAKPRMEPVASVRVFAAATSEPRASDLYVAPLESLTVPAVPPEIDDFVFVPPPIFFAPADPPSGLAYHHLPLDRIAHLLQVPDAATGSGVRVAVVDTGFHPHPYYSARALRYRAVPTESAPQPEIDTNGHGTAISANVFATARDAEVLGFQSSGTNPAALEDAADSGADVISCSWGWNHEQSFPVLELTINDIVQEGKIVLFAAGNGHLAWPGSMPAVLSVGGVFADPNNELEASNYASGFQSSLYPGRRVPNVSGLCGRTPKGIYIPLPCPPGSEIDRAQSGSVFPSGDTTAASDGWTVASGTSSATPQIAGVAALLVAEARRKGVTLNTRRVQEILEQSAVPVQKGRNAFGFPATGHPNVAVGFGLVNASAALALV